MRRIRPCATGLRRNATSLCPGRIMSETKLPRPCRCLASSLRRTRWPMPCVAMLTLCPSHLAAAEGRRSEAGLQLSLLRRHGVTVVVQSVLGEAEPQVRVGDELLPGLVDLLEIRVLR